MAFQQLADVAEKWCARTPFELIAAEETERRMDFYADPGVSFYVLCPDNGCGDNFVSVGGPAAAPECDARPLPCAPVLACAAAAGAGSGRGASPAARGSAGEVPPPAWRWQRAGWDPGSCSGDPRMLGARLRRVRGARRGASPGVLPCHASPGRHVWSESEDCLPFLQLAQDYISSCGKKTLHEVLEKVFKSFRPVGACLASKTSRFLE
ncbi:Maturin [Galemys pyrenaicus]|uniref:Maturin n=1 Tax=Galemys pyrenaicus TaxID=202257 RepID=A0A8J6A865_GALPY|nr:Maturin [Galemys pyrenaicus]